ncbi:unnamed protein product [Psylliodes chrysocephalus]|uniref:Pre-mRNA cleavage complex 2 protein Pcf11 n=1 Tax=Psylliodes chrysocephalus TaxID=3402493 RepID=A0A9P0GD06_9CUCU|nr:unnamed protein product [Psylliodes chrysocephala]
MNSPEEIKAEYASSLGDLTFNSKPLINVLTMLADENSPNAKVIVEAIEEQLSKVQTDVKLPLLYLIDCIVKNVGGTYTSLFSQNIVSTFCGVFKVHTKSKIYYACGDKKYKFKVDEKTRAEMYKLRQTWNEVFPQMKLYAIDVQISLLDPAWPVTAKPPPNSIHFNPKFLKNTTSPNLKPKSEAKPTIIPGPVDKETLLMQEQLIQKQKELLELQQKKLELEVLQTQVKLQEQIKQTIPITSRSQNILLKPEVAKQLVPSLTHKPVGINASLALQQKTQQFGPSNGTKINPVSSALINARPVRDPRLMRQQQQKQLQQQQAPDATTTVQVSQPQSTSVTVSKDMDVDLRQLPAFIGKKRLSTDSPDQTSVKKSKSEILDKLFGDEDTDLRQFSISSEQRPKTPPPPIISSSEVIPSKTESPKSNLDAIRAKLANATNRDKVLAKSFNKKKLKLVDQDLRQPIQITPETTQKIIISPEDESNIKSGNMTNEESKKLLAKIILQMEKNKLKEAKRKDHEETFNISLQPISDEEFIDSDGENVEHNDAAKDIKPKENVTVAPLPVNEESLMPFNDKDERLIPGPLPPPQSDFMHPNFYPRDGREMRRFPGPNNWRGGRGNRRWDNAPVRMPVRPWNAWKNNLPPFPPHNNFEEIHIPDEEPTLTSGFVNVDEIKAIAIDGISRDIRFYGETAIAFIDWDDPRELTFHEGTRKITFNDKETYVLGFNENYKEFMIDGKPHLVRLGAPSREIFIDNVPYECLFGSPGIRIDLDGVPTKVQLEGPIPQVNIGKIKRTDLVAGKINLFINAMVVVPVFLDAKVQKFVLDNETSTLKFVDALKTVLINDVPFNNVEYGGLPKPFIIHGKKHFIRFSVLPKGIKPGRVQIVDMEGEGSTSPRADENSQDGMNPSDAYDPGMPITGLLDNKPVDSSEVPDRNTNSPNFYQKLILQQQNNLDALSNAMTPVSGPLQATGEYKCENDPDSQGIPVAQTSAPQPAAAININDLFQKLVASGFVTSVAAEKKPVPPVVTPVVSPVLPPVVVKEDTSAPASVAIPERNQPRISSQLPPAPLVKAKRNPCMNLKPINFNKPETLRVRQGNLYSILYSGMQCSSCGMRFSPEASMQYSQHLDWHFRQNRKGKRNSRVATSRRWYYSLADWKNYEELEDLEEREKNYFDQQQQADGAGEEAEEEVEIPSVAADPDTTQESCKVCHDTFDQFFNEEKEEWHLKNAIRVDDNTYHPLCYEDYQQSLLEQTLDESIKPIEDKPREEETIPGLEIIIDDDDEEDEISEPSKSTEILCLESDESKPSDSVQEPEEPEPPQQTEDEGDDDDVILNEIAPIKIVVDDDDDEPGTDSTAALSQAEDDGFVEIAGLVSLPNGKHVKIKAEPVDKDLEDLTTTPLIPDEQPVNIVDVEEHNSTNSVRDLVASIDGNVDIAASGAPTGAATGISGNKIKINISKQLTVINKEKELIQGTDVPSETYIDPFEPFPPGEEPEPAALKTTLKSVRLTKLPPVRKGTELTGLCSIM